MLYIRVYVSVENLSYLNKYLFSIIKGAHM